MGTICSSKKFQPFIFDESVDEENPRWKSAQSAKKNSGDVDKYTFLQSFAGAMNIKGKKPRNETVIIHEDDEEVNERIYRSDAALQSSSSIYNSKNLSGSRCHDPCTSYPRESFNTSSSQKAAADRKDSDHTKLLHLADNEFVSIISDDENDNSSTMSSNDLAEVEDSGSSGERILEHDIPSSGMESSVVVYPKCVTFRRDHYCKAQLTFFCNSIKLDVLEKEGDLNPLTFEWKTVDLISIESRWLEPLITAEVCLHIKLENPKLATSVSYYSGILEVKFTVDDPCWSNKQELIKSLDEQYKEKWDVDLDSYELFEDITYLEGDCDSISISKSDFQMLQPEKFINDTIVDFYIEYLKKIKPADARVHFFNSFFFRKLADFDEKQSQFVDSKAAFQRVRKWTKKVNIFQTDYIFIPVNFRLHWSLIVICHPGEVVNFKDDELEKSLKVPCILHMDSIKGSHRGLEDCIRCYLWEEWKERNNGTSEDISSKFKDLRFLRLEVPQQENSYDCGMFMLHYMELFVKQAPICFNPLRNFFSKDWFCHTEASLKRGRIKKMIFELAKTNAQSSRFNEKSSYQLKDEAEEESEVEILDETCNSSKETSDTTPIIVKPLRSECLNADDDEHMDITLSNSDINGADESYCQEFSETEDNRGSLIADNDQNYGQMVLYDPSINVLSPIKEIDKTEGVVEKQLVVYEPTTLTNAETNQIDSFMTCIDEPMNLLQLNENSSSSSSEEDDVHEALIVEDSDEDECCPSSGDEVIETCVVDSDDSSDLLVGFCKDSFAPFYQKATSFSIRKDVAGNCLNSKRRGHMVSKARKRRRRNS